MPFRQRGSYGRRRRSGLSVINSIKNQPNFVDGVATATNLSRTIALAVSSPDNTVSTEVENGSKIFRFYFEWWYYGLSAGNTNDIVDAYIIHNPGTNLTLPNPGSVGTSNEKKFVFKTWKGLGGNKSLGGQPYSWRGWIKVPRTLQRMGTDDAIQFVVRSPTTGNSCFHAVYKWFS